MRIVYASCLSRSAVLRAKIKDRQQKTTKAMVEKNQRQRREGKRVKAKKKGAARGKEMTMEKTPKTIKSQRLTVKVLIS